MIIKGTTLQTFTLRGNVFYTDRLLEKTETGQSYKANLSYTPNDETLLYAQWSEGFRLGSPGLRPNPSCDADNDGILDDVGFATPDGLDSDTSENFELGLKAAFEFVTVNLALYHIDWEGIPVRFGLPSCNSSVTLNAGKSTSEGAELEVQAFISDNLRMDLSASYGETTLAEDASNIGVKGDNLPDRLTSI